MSEVEGLIEVLHLKTINKHKSGSFAFPRDDDIVGVGETMTVVQIGYGQLYYLIPGPAANCK